MTCAGLRTDLTADPEKPLRTSVLPQKTVSIGLDSESFTVAHSTPFFEYVNPRCTFYSQRDRHGVKSVSSAPKYVNFCCVQTGPRTQANRFVILKTSLGICTYAAAETSLDAGSGRSVRMPGHVTPFVGGIHARFMTHE